MTIGELIQLLQTDPSHLRVVVNGYENGSDDHSPEQIVPFKIDLNTGKREWEGRHGNADGIAGTALDGADVADALVLR